MARFGFALGWEAANQALPSTGKKAMNSKEHAAPANSLTEYDLSLYHSRSTAITAMLQRLH